MSADGPTVSSLEWEQKFEAIARLYREAHDKLESDPLSAALRARQAIEHIADYLHVRELGPTARNEMLDAKLKRLEAKLVFSRMVGTHLGTVQIHTNSVIHPGAMLSDPNPDHLRPCLGSLVIVVEWFFREYLKRAAPVLRHAAAVPPRLEPAPDATPINSTMATLMNVGTRFGTGIGEFIPVWRETASASTLRLDAEGDVPDQRVFKVSDPNQIYFIGRMDQRSDGTRNDFPLPKTWNSISRDQGTIATVESAVVITNTSNNPNVFVRGELVAKGAARALRHGDSVQLGRCVGTFSDGRYYSSAPATTVDARTGLLSRLGLVAEISGFLATGKPRVLFVVRCPDASGAATDPERLAAMVALAIHRHAPSVPVARIEMDVAVLLPPDAAVDAIAVVADRVVGARCVSGFLAMSGAADQALPRLEACLGALSRVAIAGREPTGPEDLTRYALTPTPLDGFAARVQPLFELGGGALLFVLDELDRLEQLAPQAIPVLELELVEMLGARMGPYDVVSFAGPGLLLFGTSGDVERFAHELGVAWHARGPVMASALEIDRGLSSHLLGVSDLANIEASAALFARGGTAALGASSLPAPLALAARAIEDSRDAVERVRALVNVVEIAWKLLAFVLVASTRGAHAVAAPAEAPAALGVWPGPWRAAAREAGKRLDGQPTRMAELAAVVASADRMGPLHSALDAIADAAQLVIPANPDVAVVERVVPRVEKAVREFLAALGPLRGWTLVGVEDAEVVDPDGLTQRIEYVDYTGPNARGSQQRVTVMGFRGLGRFAYLVRWNEGIAIALEPFARRVRNEVSGDSELFLAKAPVTEPGMHRYRSVATTHELELTVTVKQLGAAR